MGHASAQRDDRNPQLVTALACPAWYDLDHELRAVAMNENWYSFETGDAEPSLFS
jgi:hypothetical protein